MKYVIELEDKPLCVFDKDTQTYFPRLRKVKGFNHLVFDEEGLKRLEPLTAEYIKEHFNNLLSIEYEKGLIDGRSQGEEYGYKKCLSENDFDSPCVSCDKYNKGFEDAWELAQRISIGVLPNGEFGYGVTDLMNIFGQRSLQGVFSAHTAQEALAKLQAYEQKQKEDSEIKSGDVVIYNNTTKCVVVTPENNGRYASIFDSDGRHYSADHRELCKTGESCPELATLLEKMKGE